MIKAETHRNGLCVVSPGVERLTAATAVVFKEEAGRLIDAGHDRLIIDLTDVSFIDSSGIAALVGLLKRVGNRGEIVVCGLASSVAQMFRITRMDRVFPSYPDSAAALVAVEAQA
ncbi:STAS domain-containing protein [Phaeovulum sp. W22_SRMD_FR3]|uniref:STAS domain-containing protein n=1 Tax=Phaeovulum sp. W22_SRMD_FR3 TaxID=3240274 RepID=UPI003F9972D8